MKEGSMLRKMGILGISLALMATWLTHAVAGEKATAARCAQAHAPGGEWPSYGHDLHNTRTQDDERKIGPSNVASLQPAWAFSIAGVGATGNFQSTPVVADGCMFVTTSAGWVIAVNADTAKLVWKRPAAKKTSGFLGGLFAPGG